MWTVSLHSNSSAWVALTKNNLASACGAMGNAILSQSRALAPYLTGQLRSDGRVEGSGTDRDVVFGDTRTPYARRRHFENNKHPGTLLYLQRGGDSVAKKGIKSYL